MQVNNRAKGSNQGGSINRWRCADKLGLWSTGYLSIYTQLNGYRNGKVCQYQLGLCTDLPLRLLISTSKYGGYKLYDGYARIKVELTHLFTKIYNLTKKTFNIINICLATELFSNVFSWQCISIKLFNSKDVYLCDIYEYTYILFSYDWCFIINVIKSSL